jgi:glycosyltransferase involved in cell wall biosynthesis
LRLCYVANPNSIHTHRWVSYFAERGHEIHLIGEHTLLRPVPSGIKLYDLTAQANVPKLRYPVWGLWVRRLVQEIQPDLLHAHQVASAGWLGAAADYHPFLVTAWGSDLLLGPVRSWAHRRLARWVLRRADYVTCVSEELAHAARSLGANGERLEVAPWGVDTNAFHPGPQSNALRQELGLAAGPVILSIRAIRPVYNPLDLAQAIPLVLARVPDAQFVVRSHSYDANLLDRVHAVLDDHGVRKHVYFVGDLPDDGAIAELYRLADVAVSVPSSDGTPQSVLEAMACGVPLVLSDVPSLHEWVRDAQEGLFVPTGDAEAISAAIVRVLTDRGLRSRLQTAGLRLVQQRADSRLWMAHAEDMYQRLTGQGSANEGQVASRQVAR